MQETNYLWTLGPFTFFFFLGATMEYKLNFIEKVIEKVQDWWDGLYKY